MLSHVSQTQKDKYYTILTRAVKFIETESRTVATRARGGEGINEKLAVY